MKPICMILRPAVLWTFHPEGDIFSNDWSHKIVWFVFPFGRKGFCVGIVVAQVRVVTDRVRVCPRPNVSGMMGLFLTLKIFLFIFTYWNHLKNVNFFSLCTFVQISSSYLFLFTFVNKNNYFCNKYKRILKLFWHAVN